MLILLLEDHKPIREMLKMALTRDKHDVLEAENSNTAMQIMREQEPDIAIVDWMLPDISGVEFIRWLRRQKGLQTTPVMMLTAKAQEADTVTGLDAGADDYMSKPVSIVELLARVRALGRRPREINTEAHILSTGEFKIDTAKHQVWIREKPANIRQTEYKLLCFFVAHPDRVWSREQILDRVWGRSVYVDERTVDVHILRLRKALKVFAVDHLIQTVRGAGYQFLARDPAAETP